MNKLKRFVRGFWEDTEGAVTVEFVIMMPMLFWAFMASYTFFDGYRQSALNVKAAYTISDLISRETEAINDTYIDSMKQVMELMVRPRSKTKLRISVARWDEEDQKYYVDWSKARGFSQVRTNETIQDLKTLLPKMPDAERVIVVETWNRYVPLYNVGLGDRELENLVFTRPRFAPQVAFE